MDSKGLPPPIGDSQRLTSSDGNHAQESSSGNTTDLARLPTLPQEIQDMIIKIIVDEPKILLLEPVVRLVCNDDIEMAESALYDEHSLDSEKIEWHLRFRSNYHAPSILQVCKYTRDSMSPLSSFSDLVMDSSVVESFELIFIL
jgi:hypothetical protein